MRSRGDGGKIEWKLSQIYTRAVSKGQNESIGKFKMISIEVMEYIYIPTGNEREQVRFNVDCFWKE